MSRRAATRFTAGFPAMFEVTDRGMLVHVGQHIIGVESGSADHDDRHAIYERARAVIEALVGGAVDAVCALDDEIAALDDPQDRPRRMTIELPDTDETMVVLLACEAADALDAAS